jgi:hypothetical protein
MEPSVASRKYNLRGVKVDPGTRVTYEYIGALASGALQFSGANQSWPLSLGGIPKIELSVHGSSSVALLAAIVATIFRRRKLHAGLGSQKHL